MPESMHYRFLIEFDIQIAKWRIDDPTIPGNSDWILQVYDRNLQQWVNANNLTRPGEHAWISKITLLPIDETSGRTPEAPTDDVSPSP